MNHKIGYRLLALAAGMVVFFGVLSGCTGTGETPETESSSQTTDTPELTDQPAIPELLLQSVAEDGDRMTVTTTYGTVSYPAAFADVIAVSAEYTETVATLTFSAADKESVYPMYVLSFGDGEGSLLGTIRVSDRELPVYASLYAAGDYDLGLLEGSYLAAQETINDVIGSLEENPSFVSAGGNEG